MNRFKQMMALTAACVITATAVSVGGTAYADGEVAEVLNTETVTSVEDVTEEILPITDSVSVATEDVEMQQAAKTTNSLQKAETLDGKSKVQNTTKLKLTFDKKPVGLTRLKIAIWQEKVPASVATVKNIETSESNPNELILTIDFSKGNNVRDHIGNGQNISVNLQDTDAQTFTNKQAVTRIWRDETTSVMPSSATITKNQKNKIKVVFLGEKKVHVNPNALKGFSIQSAKKLDIRGIAQSPDQWNANEFEVLLDRNVESDEDITLIYDPTSLSEDLYVMFGNDIASGFRIQATNESGVKTKLRVLSIIPIKPEKGKATTALEVKFENAPAQELTVEDFVLSAATVKKVEVKPNTENKVYVLTIADVKNDMQTLSAKKADHEFIGDGLTFKVSVDKGNDGNGNDNSGPGGQKPQPQPQPQPQAPSTGGGSSRSSVRPNSDSKSDVKKDEMKKDEMKKDEMKKDEMSNTAKSTEKVSTKLVIGQKTYTAMINGQAVQKTADVAPQVHQGRTVLLARMISELLGVDVKFDQKSKTASFMYGEGNKVELTLGQKFMMVNGEKVALTADILNKDGRILLPVTDIQKAFAKLGLTANVSWDAATKSVTIEK